MLSKINPSIFRGFSVRGVVGEDFDVLAMKDIGYAVGNWFRQVKGSRLVVGYDVRATSPALHKMLCEGLLSTGADVISIGLVPTPVLNFATDYYSAKGGIMVTASHNPAEYNGLKIRADRTIFGSDLQKIYGLISSDEPMFTPGTMNYDDPINVYIDTLLAKFAFQKYLRIVVDGGNGANGKIVPSLLRQFGHEVVELFCDLDGNFPNRDPDPSVPDATTQLSSIVVSEKADLGLAFDGDGDRVILVDEMGNRILGDQILMILAGYAIENKTADKIVYEVLCSHALPDYVSMKGGTPIPAPSGYAFVHDVMLSEGAKVGGEMSGHLFLTDDDFKFDDAILAACQVLSILSSSDKPLSGLISELPSYFASDEYRIDCGKDDGDKHKIEIVKSLREHYTKEGYSLEEIDGISIDFGDTWALIRQSNTQPVISLRIESKLSVNQMNKVKNAVFSQVAKEFNKRDIPWPLNP
ncbi:MAG TPA: phosphomannomutase/phosphoglucomutase [Anaerolineales bacterium]|nr:phosphomannomutase/phosphoglucomutase [Anaerolineales bacterium]